MKYTLPSSGSLIRKASHSFAVWVAAFEYRLYLSWEYKNLSGFDAMEATCQMDYIENAQVVFFSTKKEAERFADRVRQAAILFDHRPGDKNVFVKAAGDLFISEHFKRLVA